MREKIWYVFDILYRRNDFAGISKNLTTDLKTILLDY